MVAILGVTLFSIFSGMGDRAKCVLITFASITRLESLWAHWRTVTEIRIILRKWKCSLKIIFSLQTSQKFCYVCEHNVMHRHKSGGKGGSNMIWSSQTKDKIEII